MAKLKYAGATATAKKIKYWSRSGVPLGFSFHGNDIYVAALSRQEACDLLEKAFGMRITSPANMSKEQWNPTWGSYVGPILGDQSVPGVFVKLGRRFFKAIDAGT